MSIIAPFVIHRKRSFAGFLAIAVAVLCLIAMLSQTAFAENTYVITDGKSVTVYTTHTSDPDKVLAEAGVAALSAEDFYTTGPGDGVSEITVQRQQTVTVYYGEEMIQMTTYGESLSSLLVRMGIVVDNSIQTSQPLDTMTYDGMNVRVDRIRKTSESYTVDIPYNTSYVEDPTLAEGEEKVLVDGQAGQMLCSANIVYVNTQEQSRSVYRQEVVTEPVDQVIAVGTGTQAERKEGELYIGDGLIILPSGEVLTYTHTDIFKATAYTHTDDGCDEYTANGARVKVGVVAVDPKVVPYGTRMFIVTNDGEYIYGLGTAEDCGGAIINKRLDLYFETDPECWAFGVRDCTVYFLGGANWRDN